MLDANTSASKNSLETWPDQIERMIKGTSEALRPQGEGVAEPLNVGNALQIVYALYTASVHDRPSTGSSKSHAFALTLYFPSGSASCHKHGV